MDSQRVEELLAEIRDHQAEALELQRRATAIIERQYDRAEKLQDRAEAMQARGEGMVKYSRRALIVIFPVLFGLVGYVSWLLFGRLGL